MYLFPFILNVLKFLLFVDNAKEIRSLQRIRLFDVTLIIYFICLGAVLQNLQIVYFCVL